MRASFATMIAVATALAGCGGGSPATTTSQPAQSTATKTITVPPPQGRSPAATIESVLTATDPNIGCGVRVTLDYVNKSYGGIQGCAAALRSGSTTARSVRIVSLRSSGARATAKVVATGGASAGETLTVTLLHEGVPHQDQLGTIWRVDSVRSNVPVGP
jgi:hypothetical protein